jgi:betaine-aldehyde dehydrogenase
VLVPHPRGELAAERIARLFARGSLPEGLLAVAPGATGFDPDGLDRIFLPGGRDGRAMAATCAELGIEAFVDDEPGGVALVLSDAPVARAARGVANAAFAGGGRTRGAAKRAWVARELHDAWVATVVSEAARRPTTAGGELAADLVADAVGAGARLLCGGPAGGGAFAPAVLTGVTPDMRIAYERAPAPVLGVTAVASTGGAIEGANESRLVAGASVWTDSRYEGARIARELEATPTWLNDHEVGPALPAVPLGPGLGGEEGVRAYAAARPIVWEPSATAAGLWWGPYDERFTRAARAVARLRSARDRDRERAWRDGAIPIARVAARALRRR